MRSTSTTTKHPDEKVYYRPIEAAIRWSGLVKAEQAILEALNDGTPYPQNLSRWPDLLEKWERIQDALTNGELPFGRDGITLEKVALVLDHQVTIRHKDLKRWMASTYADDKPPFLFAEEERTPHCIVSVDTFQDVLAETADLRSDNAKLRCELDACMRERDALRATVDAPATTVTPVRRPDGGRSEPTSLAHIGALVKVALGDPSDPSVPRLYDTQDALIQDLVERYPVQRGFGERTLKKKFAEARRALAGE